MAFLRLLRALLLLVLLALVGAALLVIAGGWRRGLPDPDLARPGMIAGARLASLPPDRCRALLNRSGVRYASLPPRDGGTSCGFRDGVRWEPGGAREAGYAPGAAPLACPLAAGLAAWEWDVVQPAATQIFGTTVTRIDHFGSYACRRLYGQREGGWSEHARAAAIDVAGFRLADGRRITVAGDWAGQGREAAFLRRVRDGACGLFATTLSPDYNAAHRDHLHLDMARRGGWRACR